MRKKKKKKKKGPKTFENHVKRCQKLPESVKQCHKLDFKELHLEEPLVVVVRPVAHRKRDRVVRVNAVKVVGLKAALAVGDAPVGGGDTVDRGLAVVAAGDVGGGSVVLKVVPFERGYQGGSNGTKKSVAVAVLAEIGTCFCAVVKN
jgi:hypothetical protein